MQDGERLLAHLLAEARVKAEKRLVHKEHAWSRRDGAGKRHALLLFARQDVRIFARIMSEADALERGMCLGLGLAPGERF